MDETNLENLVQSSNNYDQFVLLSNNRDQNRGHIEAIKSAFAEMGNLTRVQPILVNERYEIIDGQHRFIAAKELNEPIFFTMQPGLSVADARNMNILHRAWRLDDFVKSYAESGDTNYQKYLQLKEDYGFSHSIIMTYTTGSEKRGAFAAFRRGEFVATDMAAARARLDKLTEAAAITKYGRDKFFAYAYLKAMEVPGFDQQRMLRKLAQTAEQLVRRFGQTSEYLRALEEVYNYQITETNRLRLY